ncbi:MAG: alkaline phosphatase family protein [Cyanobacteria bacterium J06634_5]
MKHRVVAIGLDAADPEVLDQWMAEGCLENLRTFKNNSAYGSVTNIEHYRAETPWTTFLTGCWPKKVGHWGPIVYQPSSYDAEEPGAYRFEDHPPFYALSPEKRVAVFDMPQVRLVPNVNGVQILGWGSHSQQGPSCSVPAERLQQIRQKHGAHPAYDEASWGTSDHANCYDTAALTALKHNLLQGLEKRSAIFQDLLVQEPWDLCMTLFAEAHSSSHSLWHLSREHPLFSLAQQQQTGDAMREVFQAMDTQIGRILTHIPDDTYTVIFSGHGMQANALDVPSMMLLSEFMHRWHFRSPALAPGDMTQPLSPPQTNYPQHWKHELWKRRAATATGLASPTEQQVQGDPLSWMPANWYKPLWPEMRAFALPSYSEGQIRVNLRGREAKGTVPPAEYEALCDELCEQLYQLVDARTGKPVVKQIVRTRQAPYADSPHGLPADLPADLLVHWDESRPTDVVEHPQFGRIGPVPFFRTGGHRSHGFLMVKGPGIEPGTRLNSGEAPDITATLLALMGVPIPNYFDGRSLIHPFLSSTAPSLAHVS